MDTREMQRGRGLVPCAVPTGRAYFPGGAAAVHGRRAARALCRRVRALPATITAGSQCQCVLCVARDVVLSYSAGLVGM